MPSTRSPISRASQAERFVAGLFEDAGWTIDTAPEGDDDRVDLSVHRGNQRYAVEIKSSQGRADRVVPLLAQAILQAQTLAIRNAARLRWRWSMWTMYHLPCSGR